MLQPRKAKRTKQNMQAKVDYDGELENDYFIDEEVSKSDTKADEYIDRY